MALQPFSEPSVAAMLARWEINGTMSSTYRHNVLERTQRAVTAMRAKPYEAPKLLCEVPACPNAGQIILFNGVSEQFCPVYCPKHSDRVS